jgi:hypothetical protein
MTHSNKLNSNSNKEISYPKRFFPPPVREEILVWLLSLSCLALAVKDPSTRPNFIQLSTQVLIAHTRKRN